MLSGKLHLPGGLRRAASKWNNNKSMLISSGIVGHIDAFNNQSKPSARPAPVKWIDNLRLFGGDADKFKRYLTVSNSDESLFHQL